jgi:hypothetical protein
MSQFPGTDSGSPFDLGGQSFEDSFEQELSEEIVANPFA